MVGGPNKKSLDVCVIGCGCAGLISIKELRDAGHKVTCFSRESAPGGTWAFRTSKCTAIYKNLRTNLPRDMMAFECFKFRPKSNPSASGSFSGDARRFPSHFEVFAYLNAFKEEFKLEPHIKHSQQVTNCVKQDDKWIVTSVHTDTGKEEKYKFDAVVSANGHFSKPWRPATFKGEDTFPGKIVHS